MSRSEAVQNDTIETALPSGLELRSSRKLGLAFLTRDGRTIELDQSEVADVCRWGRDIISNWNMGRNARWSGERSVSPAETTYRAHDPDVAATRATVEAGGSYDVVNVTETTPPPASPVPIRADISDLPHLSDEQRRKLNTIQFVRPKHLVTDQDRDLLERGLIEKRGARYQMSPLGRRVARSNGVAKAHD